MSAPHLTLFTAGDKLLITTRGDNYQAKANGVGYCGSNRQVHHVLPCGSLNQSKEDFIAKAAEPAPTRLGMERIVNYNVNEPDNLIGLPTAKVYAMKFCKPFSVVPRVSTTVNAAQHPLVAACNYAIHLWNHPEYSRQAKIKVNKVWAHLALKIKKHKPVEAKDLGATIRNVSKGLRIGLENPGKKAQRSQQNWQAGKKTAFDII